MLDFVEKAKRSKRNEREADLLEKEGVFTGSFCINPVTGKKMPIYVANFVLMAYGTGAVMAVPAHDQRDFEFAQKYGLPIEVVIKPAGAEQAPSAEDLTHAFEEDGVLVDSGEFSGMESGRRPDCDNRGPGKKRACRIDRAVPTPRLGNFAAALLGRAHSDHLLREVRCCAGPRTGPARCAPTGCRASGKRRLTPARPQAFLLDHLPEMRGRSPA